MAESASQVVKKETGFSKSVSNQVPGNQTSINTDDIVLSAKKEVADRGDTRKRLVKYGIISAALGLIIIVAVIALDYANKTTSEVVNNTFLELHKPQELEKEQLQIEAKAEAEVLKKERDVVLAKIKEEKDAKEEAEKLAAEKLAAEKAALAKRKAAEWDKERLFQQARLERKKRIKQQEEARQQQEEARRLELEWLEQERQALREAQALQ